MSSLARFQDRMSTGKKIIIVLAAVLGALLVLIMVGTVAYVTAESG